MAVSTQLFSWPLDAPAPVPLANLNCNLETLRCETTHNHLETVLDASLESDLLRIGLYKDNRKTKDSWVGSLASTRQLESSSLLVHLGPDNEPFHVSTTPAESPAVLEARTDSSKASPLRVQLAIDAVTPRPSLARPEAAPVEVQEKSLLQRYWWLLPIAMFLMLGGGGGGGQ